MTNVLLVASALICQVPTMPPAPAPMATAPRVATREAVAAWLAANLAARQSTDRLPSNFNSSRKRDHYVRKMSPKAAGIAKGAGLTVAELEAGVRDAVARGEPGTAAELAEARRVLLSVDGARSAAEARKEAAVFDQEMALAVAAEQRRRSGGRPQTPRTSSLQGYARSLQSAVLSSVTDEDIPVAACEARTANGPCRRLVAGNPGAAFEGAIRCYEHRVGPGANPGAAAPVQGGADPALGAAAPVAFSPCGAPTKDGTPCRRPVAGGGRCFQHR
jgi:hypothetical protein